MKRIKSLYSPIYYVILLGETVKAALSLWIIFLSPYSHILIPCYLILQATSSPLQGGKSDNICRKSALLVTILATGTSQIFFFLSLIYPYGSLICTVFLIAGLFIQGRWANIPSVGRAALSDAENHSLLAFTIPLSFAILSVPWIFMVKIFPKNLETAQNLQNLLSSSPLLNTSIKSAPIVIAVISVIIYLYTKRQFEDKRDRDLLKINQKSEPKIMEIIRSRGIRRILLHAKYEPFFLCYELKNTKQILNKNALGWIGGILYELGFHSIFYYLDESSFFIKGNFSCPICLFTYFIAGTLLRPVFVSSNTFGILLGIIISIASVLVQILLPDSSTIWQSLLGLGTGLFLSCFYLHYLSNQKMHIRGKIVGAADSMQTIGEVLGTAIYSLLSFGFVIKMAPNLLYTEVKYFPLFLFTVSFYCLKRSFSKERN